MAKAAKSAAAKVSRKRLTTEQKSQIADALARGETGKAIAAKFGISAATAYTLKRKGAPASRGESPLRAKLVSFAVRTLLAQSVTTEETAALKSEVDAELVKRVSAGI